VSRFVTRTSDADAAITDSMSLSATDVDANGDTDAGIGRARVLSRWPVTRRPLRDYSCLPMILITRSLPSRSGYVSPRSMKPVRVYSRIAGSFVEVTPRPMRT
jgi:hypothetical protein